jgi:ABC-2 type transport system ATP-binding protein
VTAVAGIDLEVPRGEIYGFLGRNGAGKTTTLRMLMGILRPDRGTIELLGRAANRIGPKEKRQIGYVSQEQFFYPWMSARELGRFVSGFYPTWDQAEFDRLLRVLDIPERRRASELSGGTRTKLGLALALAHHPELLLLDEPTTGLDPVARHEFLEMLLHEVRHRGQTAFFSSHLVGEVEQVATRVGILQRGTLRYQGTLERLRASVRRVTLEAGAPLPEGHHLLWEEVQDGVRRAILHAPPEAWTRPDAPLGEGEPLPLEEIFLAYARESAPRA